LPDYAGDCPEHVYDGPLATLIKSKRLARVM
jgi:hypothetical protein